MSVLGYNPELLHIHGLIQVYIVFKNIKREQTRKKSHVFVVTKPVF